MDRLGCTTTSEPTSELRKKPKRRKKVQVVLALVERRGKVLLVRDRDVAQGQWVFPGGKIEKGETQKEAVVRELLEETQSLCTPLRKVGRRTLKERKLEIFYWQCSFVKRQKHPVDAGEILEVRWIPLQRALKLLVEKRTMAPSKISLRWLNSFF